jgi:pimeloyl-ACP methyl ester carboxylesterase
VRQFTLPVRGTPGYPRSRPCTCVPPDAPVEKSPLITRPVVLVHGVRTSSAIWTDQVAALAHHGHRTVAVDLPGHGLRTHERFTLAGAMQTIDDAVTACATPPLLVGLSLGGYMSLAYAARHPTKLAGVLLAGCSTELRGKPLGAYRTLAHHVTGALRLGGGTWHVVSDMLAAVKGYSPLADLRRVHVPVWLVNGRRDPLRLDERRYVSARPGTRLTVVPRAGHDVNSHAPAAFNRVLLAAMHELRLPEPVLARVPALV